MCNFERAGGGAGSSLICTIYRSYKLKPAVCLSVVSLAETGGRGGMAGLKREEGRRVRGLNEKIFNYF